MKNYYSHFANSVFVCLVSFLLASCGSDPEKSLFSQPYSLAVLNIPDVFQYDFGSVLVESAKDHTFTVVNEGKREAKNITAAFTISAFEYKGGFYPGFGGTCGSQLAAGASCTIVVSFIPQYSDSFSEFINLNYYNGERTDLASPVQLLGRGISGTAGLLDSTFQGTGLATLLVGSESTSARQVVCLPDRSILVAGDMTDSGQSNFFLVKLRSDGQLDPAFGTGGVSVADFAGGNDFVTSMVVLHDGKVLVAGRAFSSGAYRFAFWRLTSDGADDSTFGAQGKLLFSVGSANAFLAGIAEQSDYSVLAGGYVDGGVTLDLAAARILPNGNLDGSFGTGGKTVLVSDEGDDLAHAVALQSDGKILLGGESHDGTDLDMKVTRLLSSGALDPTFGTNGAVAIDFTGGDDRAMGLAIQFDEKIVIAGSNGQFALARLLSTGALDTSFGGTGKVMTTLPLNSSAIQAISLQTDGKIVASGYGVSGTDTDVTVARYLLTGMLDASFGNNGKISYTVSGSQDKALHSDIASNGKIVLVGAAVHAQSSALIARLWP